MGTSFFWFYDIVLLAVVAGVTFRSIKKGGVAMIISTVSILIAFLAAHIGSNAVSETLYTNYIKEPLTDYIDQQIDGAVGDYIYSDFEKIDMSKAVVGGKFLDTIELKPNSAGKIILDLSDIDLTETGIEEADFSMFGIGEDFDYSLVKVGNIEITERELEQYSLETIVLAHIFAANLESGEAFTAFKAVSGKISEALPLAFGDYSAEVSGGDTDVLYELALSVTDLGYDNRGEAVISNIIDPIVITPLRIVLFLVIFGVVAFILEAIATATKIINHIPVISTANEAIGGIMGLVKSVIILFIICIAVQLLISLTNDSLVFINTYTIDKTLFFKHLYNFDPINFLKTYM
ncbi:MAG: hypothetical protein IJ416_11255 [Ruminiclostridium sp.]|nr:hypothetical protein [Ruminiclostridium sp.]